MRILWGDRYIRVIQLMAFLLGFQQSLMLNTNLSNNKGLKDNK